MQHYMDDLQDLVEGLEEEVTRRLNRIKRLDIQVKDIKSQINKLQLIVFNEEVPLEERQRKALEVADLMCEMRYASEKKVSASTGMSKIISSIFGKVREYTFNCKIELEVDNPGCAAERENLFFETYGVPVTEEHSKGLVGNLPIIDSGRQTRETSRMREDDGESVISDFSLKMDRRGVGRPRGSSTLLSSCRGADSARSSMERDIKRNNKNMPMSNYMKKKHERTNRENQLKLAEMYEMKKKKSMKMTESGVLGGRGFDQNYGSSSQRGRMDSETPSAGGDYDAGFAWKKEEDDLDLLNIFPTLPSPPREMQELMMENTFSFDTVMPGDNSQDQAMSIGKNALMGDASYERKKKAILFSSTPETSFHGRPRKFTDRATEMIQQTKAREERKKKEEDDVWCYCKASDETGRMMVMCDQSTCKIKWFHFDCVGLTADPIGEWFCPTCLKNAQDDLFN